HLRAHEPYRRALGEPALDAPAQALVAPVADRAIHEAGGAEATAPLAAAARLDEVHVAEDRLGRQDLGRRVEGVQVAGEAPLHARASRPPHADQVAAPVVLWLEAVRPVRAADAVCPLEHRGAVDGRTRGALEELGQHLLR